MYPLSEVRNATWLRLSSLLSTEKALRPLGRDGRVSCNGGRKLSSAGLSVVVAAESLPGDRW